MPELVHLRTRFSKTIDNGDGTRAVQAFPRPVHYDDGQGGMAEIDRSIVPSTRAGYDWMNAANDFEFHFKENLNQDASILFIRGGIAVATSPKGVVLHRKDTGAHLVVGTASDTTCVVDGHTITFFGLYPNCQVRYQSTATGIKEFIRMTSFNGIPDPTDYGINPDVVRIGFVSEIDAVGHEVMDDGADGSVSENTDYDIISFKKGADRPINIPKLVAWSEGGDGRRVERTVTKRIKMIGGKPHLIHGMNYADLVSRRLPYIIDASFSDTTETTNDGSWESNGLSGFYSSAVSGFFGYDAPTKSTDYAENCWFRFTGVTIPQGSTISSAIFKYDNLSGLGANVTGRYYCNDVDNAAAPVSQADAASKTKTTAYTQTNLPNATGVVQKNITTAVQEVINRPGWSSGNALMVLATYLAGSVTGRDTIRMSESSAGNDPQITITYTPAATDLEVNDVSLDIDVTPAGIYGPLTANNVTVGLSTTSATLVEAGGSLALNDVTIDTAVTSAAISFSGATLSVLSVVAGPTTTPATLIGWLEANGVSLGADITPVMLTGWFTANNVTLAPTATTAEIVGWLATNNVTLSPTTTEADLIGLLTANDVTLPPTVTPAEIVGWLSANNVTLSPTVTEADIVGWLTNNDVTLDTTATPATLNLAGDLNVIDITLDLSASSATLVGVGWSNRIDSVLAASVDSVPVANILKINGV